MGQFKSRFGSKSKPKSKDRDRDKVKKTMYTAKCGDCNKSCQVPFKPTGKHPVFCSDCFRGKDDKKSSYTSKKSISDRTNNRTSSNQGITKRQFDELVSKVDLILEILDAE